MIITNSIFRKDRQVRQAINAATDLYIYPMFLQEAAVKWYSLHGSTHKRPQTLVSICDSALVRPVETLLCGADPAQETGAGVRALQLPACKGARPMLQPDGKRLI
jgi:hypothetical protein